MGVAISYWGFSGDSSWFSIGTKSRCVYPLLQTLQNKCSNKISDDLHCNSFNSVDNYNSGINCSCK